MNQTEFEKEYKYLMNFLETHGSHIGMKACVRKYNAEETHRPFKLKTDGSAIIILTPNARFNTVISVVDV